MFSQPEIDYLKSQRLAWIATVSSNSQPDAAPVGFEFDSEHFYIGGRLQTTTLKYKNVLNGNQRVALVIDDLEAGDEWRPRGAPDRQSTRAADRAASPPARPACARHSGS